MTKQRFCLIKDIDGVPTKFLIRKSLPRLLPEGYTLVDGITTDGVAYVDTGIVPDTTSKWDFYGTLKIAQSGDQVILGSRQDAGNTRFFPFATAVNNVSKSNYAFSAYAYGNDLPLGTKYHVYTHLEAGAQSSQVEGSARPDTRGLDFPSGTVLTKSLYLFRNNYTSPNACKSGTTCWYIKGIKNGVTVCEFVSCKRNSDNAYGLYDFVTNTFHGNANTSGTLTGGQEIVEVEYLQSSGVEYIDTGLKGNQNTDYDVTAQFVGSSLSPVSRAFGTRTAALNKSVSVAGYQGSLIIGYGNQETTTTFDFNEHNYKLTDNKSYVDGSLVKTFNPNTFTTDNTIILFGGRNASSMSLSAWKYKKCYIRNDLGIRDYVPVRIGATGYFLDKANWRTYENAGTGAFTYGQDKQYEFNMDIITPLYSGGNIEVVLTTTSENETFTFNMAGTKVWGDGSSDNLTTHTYAEPGTYNVQCDGTSLGSYLFEYGEDNIDEINIIENITNIDEWAFAYCDSSPSITIPNSVTSIGWAAFYYFTGLTSITIPDSVTSIGSEAFEGCSALTSITIPDSVTSIDYAVFAGCTGLTSVTIPDSVTSIGNQAFVSCSGLTSITIPDSVTSIGYSAFEGCSGLTSITIPDSVTSIGNYTFYYCWGLTSITIGDSVTSIGDHTFDECAGLTSFEIPDSVTSIGSYAFFGCSGLTSITIPDSVTSLGDAVFASCSGLTSVTIGNSVTGIGASAFAYCSSLASVTIGNGVTSIGNNAFRYCTGLQSITYNGTTSQWATITKGSYWHGGVPTTVVHCTNGDADI